MDMPVCKKTNNYHITEYIAPVIDRYIGLQIDKPVMVVTNRPVCVVDCGRKSLFQTR